MEVTEVTVVKKPPCKDLIFFLCVLQVHTVIAILHSFYMITFTNILHYIDCKIIYLTGRGTGILW